jgi:Ca2+-binding EF-hand superfamily protein
MMDSDQSGSLDEYEFTNAVKNYGIEIEALDLKGLFKAFDQNGDGFIGYDELIDIIKGPLNPFRQQIILRVFKQLDIAGAGVLTVAQVK